MTALHISVALLIIALIISVVHYYRTKNGDVLPPKETMIIIDEAVDMTPEMLDRATKQMKSRLRKKK